jgi:SAM-dependent methyltransferase
MTTSTNSDLGLSYYDGPDDVVETIRDAVRAAGRDADRLELDDLAQLDEFHALGRPATLALAELAGMKSNARVLDVGAGIGGPARVLAGRYGARVTALDATARFCRASDWLSKATGLADRVAVVRADALELPFADASFDLVWTQALSQNVDDKARLYAEMHRVLVPGGRLAAFDVVAGPEGLPQHYPLPWANGADESFLVDAAELHGLMTGAGFEALVWNEGPAVQAAIQRAAAQMAPDAGVPGLALDLLLPDFEARMAGLARYVSEQRLGLVQAVLAKASRDG